LSQSWAKLNQSPPSFFNIQYICPCLPHDLLSGFPSKTLCTSHIMHATCLASLILHELIVLITFGLKNTNYISSH
jgi:hypothetical protein